MTFLRDVFCDLYADRCLASRQIAFKYFLLQIWRRVDGVNKAVYSFYEQDIKETVF